MTKQHFVFGSVRFFVCYQFGIMISYHKVVFAGLFVLFGCKIE